jgi:hypothetical protein
MIVMDDARPDELEPPTLPEPEPERFQFSIAQLLLLMLASAFLAALARYGWQWVRAIPRHELIGLQNTILIGVVFGGLLYFFLRAPFLALGVTRSMRRWRRLQQHRSDLIAFASKRRSRAGDGEHPATGPREPGGV